MRGETVESQGNIAIIILFDDEAKEAVRGAMFLKNCHLWGA